MKNALAPARAFSRSFFYRARSFVTACCAGLLGCWLMLRLFRGGHFFGFAFLAHHFEFAFGFFPGSLDFLHGALAYERFGLPMPRRQTGLF